MPGRSATALKIAFFIALLATALAMGAALALLLELPNKFGLPEGEYLVVQKIYRGWSQLAYLLAVELIAMLAVAWLARGEPRVLWPPIVAILCLIGAQAVFWTFTFPANVATANWTTVPDDWQALRRSWEYSHAVGAALQVLAMSALIVAVLGRRPHAAAMIGSGG
jgi:hypothetical protein